MLEVTFRKTGIVFVLFVSSVKNRTKQNGNRYWDGNGTKSRKYLGMRTRTAIARREWEGMEVPLSSDSFALNWLLLFSCIPERN